MQHCLSAAADHDQQDGSTLEAEVVMAGPRLAAALEFLAVRPVGEVAAPVRGASEVQDFSDLLLRDDAIQEQGGDAGGKPQEPADDQEEDGVPRGTDITENQEADNSEQDDSTAERAISDVEESTQLTLPPKKYLMADDLWGESQLEHFYSEAMATPIAEDASAPSAGDAAAADHFKDGSDTNEGREESINSVTAGGLNYLLQRRWTAWGPYCPVTLQENGKVVEGKKQFAVEFAGKLFLLADEEKRAKFLKDPRKYIESPPTLPRNTNVYLFGPSYAGVAKQAKLLSRTYGLVTVNVEKEIADGHRRNIEEQQRLLEEEERIKEERLLQERLQKERQREEEEQRLMRAEDNPERLALAFPETPEGMSEKLTDEDAPATSSAQESPRELQISVPLGGFGPSSGENNLSRPAETETGKAGDAADVNKEISFVTSDVEENLLNEGQALGKQSCV